MEQQSTPTGSELLIEAYSCFAEISIRNKLQLAWVYNCTQKTFEMEQLTS